jgi:hypothetical protein
MFAKTVVNPPKLFYDPAQMTESALCVSFCFPVGRHGRR